MSVLIKGMKMPQNCDACPMLYEYRFCALTDDHASSIEWKMEEKRMPNCPLIELPDHGDLIDRDAMAKDLAYDVELDDKALDDTNIVGREREYLQFDKDCKQNCMYYLTEQEAVIPAERSEDATD